MAFTILVVGLVDCNDRVNTRLIAMTLGKPLRSASEYGGLGIDVAKVGVVDMSALVESRFTVELSAVSVDAVLAIKDSISAEVRDLANITVGFRDSTFVGTLKVRIGECIEIPMEEPWNTRLSGDHVTRIEIVVRRDPYVFASTEMLHSAAGFDCPALIPLVAQTGQFSAPQDTLLDAGALELSACYVGHTDDEAAFISDFVKPLAAASWSAGAAAADTTGYPAGAGNTIWRHTAAAYTDVDVTNLDPGEYLVMANCKGTTTNMDTIQHAYCGPVLIPTTTLHLLPLGIVSLPCRAVRGAATSTLRVTITGGGAGEYASVNYIALLPVSRGLIGWRVTSGHAHRVLWADGTMYVEDVVKLNEAFGGSAPLRTRRGQLVLLAEQATPAPTTHLHVTVSDDPRWEQFPSA